LPEFLAHFHFPQYFNAIVYSGQDGVHKPDPRIFQRTLDLLQASAGSAIFIGDDFNLDILAARSVGMRAIHFDPRRRATSREADDVETFRPLLFAMLGVT
jgi:FMN phosphatase YigB (HAD superfamily)